MTETPNFREYGAQVIRESLQRMLSHAEGVRSGEDIEALHDMRVASRRLRAALGVFAAAFQVPAFPRFEREVKAVTDALGEARDLDVMIETLEKLEQGVPENERAGIESFVEEKRHRRAKRQKSVMRALDRLEQRDLGRLFEEIAARAAPPAWNPEPASALPGEVPAPNESEA